MQRNPNYYCYSSKKKHEKIVCRKNENKLKKKKKNLEKQSFIYINETHDRVKKNFEISIVNISTESSKIFLYRRSEWEEIRHQANFISPNKRMNCPRSANSSSSTKTR